MVQFLPAAPPGPVAGFAQGFQGAFPQGIQIGMQSIAQQRLQQQADLQMQMEQRRAEAQAQQEELSKITALINISKNKDPKTRKAMFEFIAPQLGFDLKNENFKSFLDLLGQDNPELQQMFETAAGNLGVDPGTTKLLATQIQDDPAGTINQLLRVKEAGLREQGLAQTGAYQQSRIAQGAERLNLSEAEMQARMSGAFQPQKIINQLGQEVDQYGNLITKTTPMAVTPGVGPQGKTTAVPLEGVAPSVKVTEPTADERKAADFLQRAQSALQDTEQFIKSNPDYNNSIWHWSDQALGAITANPTGKGGPVAAFKQAMEDYLTSDKGKEFKAAWAPFVNANLRRDTGAVINAQEWAYAFTQFIPKPNDPQEVLALKAKHRQDVIQGLKIGAGRLGGVATQPAGTPAALPPGPVGGAPAAAPAAPAAVPAAPQIRQLAPQAESELISLARKYKAGTITPEETEKFRNLARMKGYTVQ